MLNKILHLCKDKINTSYSMVDSITDCNAENTLAVIDCETQIAELKKLGFAILYVNSEDKFIDGIQYVTDSLTACDDNYFNMVFSRQKKLPLTIFRTKRTLVREITVADLNELYIIYDDELIRKYLEPLYEYEEEKVFTEKYIENMYGLYGYGLWIVEDINTGRIIGRAGISIRNINGEDCNELGYVIRKEYRNQGYAKEVCTKILNYAEKELEIKDMYIVMDADNECSEQLANSLCFEIYTEINTENSNMKIFYKKF